MIEENKKNIKVKKTCTQIKQKVEIRTDYIVSSI